MTKQQQAKGPALAVIATEDVEKLERIDGLFREVRQELILGNATFAEGIRGTAILGMLRRELTDDLLETWFVPAMNTRLGFDTDRNPRKAKRGEVVVPYSVADIRDPIIEARVHGFKAINNEFNIIAGNFYGAKNGYMRLVGEFRASDGRELTDLRYNVVPVDVNSYQTRARCVAEWRLGGQRMRWEGEILARVNSGQGWDACEGKTIRKLYARIYEQLIGSRHHWPEGEVGDEVRALGPATIDMDTLVKPADPAGAREGYSEAESKGQAPATRPPGSDPTLSNEQVTELMSRPKELGLSYEDLKGAIAEVARERKQRIAGLSQLPVAWLPAINERLDRLADLKAKKGE